MVKTEPDWEEPLTLSNTKPFAGLRKFFFPAHCTSKPTSTRYPLLARTFRGTDFEIGSTGKSESRACVRSSKQTDLHTFGKQVDEQV